MPLGRGLESLIPSKRTPRAQEEPADSVFLVDIEFIQPNPFQPRREFDRAALKELSFSIRQYGVLQPLVVRKVEEETEGGTKVAYQLIAGERRWRAAKIAGVPRVPVIVREEVSDKTSLELSLIENVQREDLNALERARAFGRLLEEFQLTQKEIAERIGKSREVIANALRLLRLPIVIQEGISRGEISEGHARALLAVEDEKGQIRLYGQIKSGGMSVRAAEEAARSARQQSKPPVREADPERAELETRIREALGVPETRITHQVGKEEGTISIRYLTKQQLRDIAKRICG